jgi:hypothetical protein
MNTVGFYIKFIRKKQLRIAAYDPESLTDKAVEVRASRPLGLYTIRGVRFGGHRQRWRIGKVQKF